MQNNQIQTYHVYIPVLLYLSSSEQRALYFFPHRPRFLRASISLSSFRFLLFDLFCFFFASTISLVDVVSRTACVRGVVI